MRTKLSFFCLLLCYLFSTEAFAQSYSVSKDQALSVAQRQFSGRDVDYFILQDNSQTEWTIFVDAEPMKGWEHECYTLTIPKTVNTPVNYVTPTNKIERKLPPSGNYAPLSVKNRYANTVNSKPVVGKAFLSNDDKAVAQRTYAIILSGGVNKLSNYERYWNDCSFIYQTLVNKYGIPKENIYPIMADGNDPAEDMRCIAGDFKSQPLDLDNDGLNEIELAATKTNVQLTLNSLKSKLNKDDHLLFYVIDHGGTTDYRTNSYICLWNYDKLEDTELANMLEPFTNKYVNVNVVLGQCFSGGFNDNLTKIGCVVSSASTGSESSWACQDIPYDEFVYQWTCAVNGATHNGVKVNADVDSNNRTTMEEAFYYAKANDRITAEHPQYVSTPISVGEDLAFNHLAPDVDLYIKDNPEDTGKEPNTTTDKFWLSPSIWVRNKADGIYEHENPYYSQDHIAVTVYVRVHNRGKKNYEKGKYYVHAYWAKASTGFRPYTWMGNEVYVNGEVTGGPMTPSSIPDIPAGEYADVEITWALPAGLLGSSSDNGSEKHHFCLLAKILDTHIEPWYLGTFSYNCRLSNKDAQKNVSIISKKELSQGTNVFIRNINDSTQKYTLELIPRTSIDEAIYSHAKIEMEMSQSIFNAWERGGLKCQNINRAPLISPETFEFVSKDSKIEAISLAGHEFDKVSLKFNFQSVPATQSKYTLDLIQKNENGEIIGGETFVVEAPDLMQDHVSITSTRTEDDRIELTTNAESNESVRWEDCNGTTIGNDKTIIVMPYNKSGNTYYAYVLSEDGEIASNHIDLDSEIGIEKISIDEQNTALSINLKNNVLTNSSIIISSITSGDVALSRNLNNDDNLISVDISSLNKGAYLIAYIYNGNVVDSVKFVKQ